MIALALRGLAARRLRSALTALAVLLGVAMIAGTYVQTDQIDQAFVDIENTAFATTDVIVGRREAFESDLSGAPQPFDASVIERIGAVDGVRLVRGDLFESGSLVRDGKRVGNGYAPGIVASEQGPPFSAMRYVRGRLPRAGEVSVNRKLADDEGLRLGTTLAVATRTGVQRARLAGVFDYGEVSSLGGATVVLAPLAEVQRWYGMEGKVTGVYVAAEDGVTPEALAERVAAVLPAGLRARTGQAEATAQADEINGQIGGFLTPMLLSLAGAAVLVGAFIIFNTFSITVAQRVREFALLRSLGATRRQLVLTVTGEALVIGAVASVLGLLAGLGFAAALGALFDAAGFGVPRAGAELAPRTIAVSLAVGIGVTVLAALVPALRATRVPPVLALAGGATEAAPRRWTPWAAGLTCLAGIALLAAGLFSDGTATSRMSGMAGGAIVLLVGIALAGRWIVRPVAAVVGAPIERLTGMPGRLARENAMRNPGRTATTSAALMVGLGLVVFVAVFAAGLKHSVGGEMDELLTADQVVRAEGIEPLPAGAQAAVAAAAGVRAAVPVFFDRVEVDGNPVKTTTDTIEGIDPARLGTVYDPDWVDGDDRTLAGLGPGEALIEASFAKAHDLAVGDRFSVRLPSGRSRTLTAIGMHEDPMILQGVLVTEAEFRALSASRDPFLILVAGRGPLGRALAGYPAAEVSSLAEYVDKTVGQFDQIVNLLYALLAMSVVISLFGIANSLFLSIHERTREFGLLRAVGATDRQIRGVVRYESVITSVIGGVLGIAVGLLFAGLMIAALSDLGLGFSVPAGQLAGFLVLAVVVGVVGSVAPARRGARVDVLEALRHD